MTDSTAVDTSTEIAALRSRAADLRSVAAALDGPLAVAYRRRAAEIELVAVVRSAREGVEIPRIGDLAA